MNFLDKRRSKLSPAEIRSTQQEARQQLALAVSSAKRKATAEVQAEVLEALAQIAGEPQPDV